MSFSFRAAALALGARLVLALFAGLSLAQPVVPGIPTPESVPSLSQTPDARLTAPGDDAAAGLPAQRFRVNSVHFSGNRLIDTAQLDAAVQPFSGRDLSASELQVLAATVVTVYRRHGVLARVRIRAVAVATGVVELVINELRIGRVLVENADVAPAMAQRLVTGRLTAGEPLPLAALESGVALLNAQPGVAAAVAIDPGSAEDFVDLTLRLQRRPAVSGRLTLDNHGMREIGQTQLAFEVRADNMLGDAERSRVVAIKTAGLDSVAPSVSFPLGGDGARLSVGIDHFRYRALRGGEAIGLTGVHSGWHVAASRPGWHSGATWMSELVLRGNRYHDDSLFGELRRRQLLTAAASLTGQWRDEQALTRGRVEVLMGRADLSGNAADLALDAASSRLNGDFWRLRWSVDRERALASGFLALRARGQWANRNLDPTQKLYLGGADRVRAFATTEALGHQGWLLGAQWRRALDGRVDGRVFVDSGRIRVNSTPWVNLQNRYTLSGAGVGLTVRLPEDVVFTTDLARQWGGHAARAPDGKGSDGRASRWRWWLALSRAF